MNIKSLIRDRPDENRDFSLDILFLFSTLLFIYFLILPEANLEQKILFNSILIFSFLFSLMLDKKKIKLFLIFIFTFSLSSVIMFLFDILLNMNLFIYSFDNIDVFPGNLSWTFPIILGILMWWIFGFEKDTIILLKNKNNKKQIWLFIGYHIALLLYILPTELLAMLSLTFVSPILTRLLILIFTFIRPA